MNRPLLKGTRLRHIVLLSILTACLPAPIWGNATDPPAESRAKLEHVFRGVADGLWKASEDAWHLGRHDICIELHRITVEVDPTFTEAYSNAAWLMWSAGRDAEAVAMYEKNIQFNGEGYDPHFDLGMYYYGKKDYLNAEANLAEATRHSAPSPVWKMLAHAQEKLSRYEDALETWESVRRMDPHDPVIDQNVRRIQEEMTARLRNN